MPPRETGRMARKTPGALRRFRSLGLVLGVALVLLTTTTRLGAQVATATVTGTIHHQNGNAAVNVLVWIAGHYRYTDVDGRYKIPGVPTGKQRMIIRRGKTIFWSGDVNVAGQTSIVDETIP